MRITGGIELLFMKKSVQVLKNEKGSAVIVWVSINLLLMSMFTALLVETGDLIVRKHKVQAVADAADLSGASAVNLVMNFDPVTKMPTNEVPVLQTDAYGGGLSQVYARELLNYNAAQMNFNQSGIVLSNVTINGTPHDAEEYFVGDPVNVTNMDGSVTTYYQSYGMTLNGYMDSPLWGSVFGQQRVNFSIPAWARPVK
jgi:hypothetical protein